MRTLTYAIPLTCFLVLIVAISARLLIRDPQVNPNDRQPSDEAKIFPGSGGRDNEPQLINDAGEINKPDTSPKVLHELILRYKNATTYNSKLAIANEAVLSIPNLLESCIWRVKSVGEGDGKLALGHIVSAYVKKDVQHKNELLLLFSSKDLHLLHGLLELICETNEIDSDGILLGKPLGGYEVPPYISSILREHPELAYSVQKALANYGVYAKAESRSLLRIIITESKYVSFCARLSLLWVDKDLYDRFDLDREGALSQSQRKDIEKYIDEENNTIPPRIVRGTGAFPRTLYADIVRFQAARSDLERFNIASFVASSQAHFWESCSWRFSFANELEEETLAYFASVYFKRWPDQVRELSTLLQSGDSELVHNLLALVAHASELDENGKMLPLKRIGGAELIASISKCARSDPSLDISVAIALGRYGILARSETSTLLRICLKNEGLLEGTVRQALLKVDPHGVCLEFGIQMDEPLTEEQRARIEKFLVSRGE